MNVITWELGHKWTMVATLLCSVLYLVLSVRRVTEPIDRNRQTVSSTDEVRPFRQPKLFGFAKVQTWANHTHSDDNSLCSLLWSIRVLIFSGERCCWRNSDIRSRKDSHSFEDARRNMGVPETAQALFSQMLALSQGLPARPPQLSGDTLYFLLAKMPTPNCKVTFWSWVPSLLWWMDISEWTEHCVPHWR